ncbi:MAG: VrrA/YqfQ family protein [Ignavibacteriales bacterium]
MNFYNPYYSYPYAATSLARGGIFARLFGANGIKFGSIVSGTQKTLGFINQVIPVVRQITPMIKNGKTMFKVMNEFKKVDTPTTNNNVRVQETTNTATPQTTNNINNDGPTFFL